MLSSKHKGAALKYLYVFLFVDKVTLNVVTPLPLDLRNVPPLINLSKEVSNHRTTSKSPWTCHNPRFSETLPKEPALLLRTQIVPACPDDFSGLTIQCPPEIFVPLVSRLAMPLPSTTKTMSH